MKVIAKMEEIHVIEIYYAARGNLKVMVKANVVTEVHFTVYLKGNIFN